MEFSVYFSPLITTVAIGVENRPAWGRCRVHPGDTRPERPDSAPTVGARPDAVLGCRCDAADMDRLRAGMALFNAGHYLAAHEPWEELWLEDPRGEREDCVQGLVQATAATYKARTGNWDGAVGLATSGRAYLGGCAETELPVDVGPLREWLAAIARDPEVAERRRPPALRLDGAAVTPADLTYPAAGEAAEALAETRGDEIVEQAVAYAEADLAEGVETSPFVALTLEYLRDGSPTAQKRLAEHVGRREGRDADVEGLFE